MTDDAAILAGLAESLGELEEPTDVVDVSKLSIAQLLARFAQVRQALYERREMMEPTTQLGRDLQSERVALLLEMNNRGLR